MIFPLKPSFIDDFPIKTFIYRWFSLYKLWFQGPPLHSLELGSCRVAHLGASMMFMALRRRVVPLNDLHHKLQYT